MRLRLVPAAALLALAGAASLATGHAQFSDGPDPSHTGAPAVGTHPAEPNCTLCHTASPAGSNLNAPGGALQILDLPEFYAPGVTYRMRVRLASDRTVADAFRHWGFQLTAVRGSDGAGTGAFTVRGAQGYGDTLQVKPGFLNESWPTRSYVEHLYFGIQEDLPSPVEWSFDWTAPAQGAGTVYFFAAGNAANGNMAPAGDWIYTTADSMRDTTTAAMPTSWGAIKARWR
jgi:hypothetical protein